jgi:methionyl-tRNA formyltransferase
MRLVVLTTETPHHAFFVRELGKSFPIKLVISETGRHQPPIETAHPFELERDQYEIERMFGDKPHALAEFADFAGVPSINDEAGIRLLREQGPDVVLVFGTGRLRPQVIQLCPSGIINLHGGDPERYRGLDSPLWAIYHREFDQLVVSLHRLNETLDDGDIILQAPIQVPRALHLYQLRSLNAELCVRLTESALDMYNRHGSSIARPQRQKGRYYSYMPSALKGMCVRIFKAYTDAL